MSGGEQRVLITGAASGLGAALADAFEARGDRVLRTDRTGLDARSLALAARPAVLRLDITSDDDWAAALAHVEETWGGLDVLVNNAGVAGGGRLDVATHDEWQWIFDINLFGMVRGLRTFVPMLKQQGSGALVNVASLAGLVHPAGMASYNAVKAAVVALTETAGHELAAHGITAHAVCPGFFRTNLMDSLQGADSALGQVMSRLVTDSPISAESVAAAVLAGLDAGDELIVPDEPAQGAVALKQTDRASYDAVMRAQARSLDKLAGEAADAGGEQ
ncbi:MAG: SDR family NAD(P)-dependent oxidoreductase [Actinomycetota bacterium]|nr:SDR family NAD(P)-dependent oxidoreductase [Actinomycetota bacterium]